jgi:hypothetical protein
MRDGCSLVPQLRAESSYTSGNVPSLMETKTSEDHKSSEALLGNASGAQRPIENTSLITLHFSLITLHFFIMPPGFGAIAAAAHAAPLARAVTAGVVE